jgi:hypothetical protein
MLVVAVAVGAAVVTSVLFTALCWSCEASDAATKDKRAVNDLRSMVVVTIQRVMSRMISYAVRQLVILYRSF